MHAHRFLGNLEQADTFHVARRAREILVDERLLQPNRLENLRSAIGLIRGDAHLRHHLGQPLADRLDVTLLRFAGVDLRNGTGDFRERFQRQVRMDRLGAVPGKQREMMDLARGAGFHDQARGSAQAHLYQMLVHRRGGEQRRNGQRILGDAAIGQDEDVVALSDRILGMRSKTRERRLHAVGSPSRGIADVEFDGAERATGKKLDVTDFFHVFRSQDRLRNFEPHCRLGDVDAKQVGPRADERHQRHHEFLADRIDRRVRHLREQLLEVVVENLRTVREHRQRGIVAHRTERLLAVLSHRRQQQLHILLRIPEHLLAVQQRDLRWRRRCWLGHVVEAQPAPVDPFAIRLLRGQGSLQFLVVDDAALIQVDQQHLSRLQTPLLDDSRLGNVEHANFRGHDDKVVVSDDKARRPQAVAVERGADLAAVGECHRRRAVPRLHQRRVVFVERATILVHQRIARPRLGNHHHHRVRQRIPAHDKQFQRVVERGRVRLAVVNQRPQLVQVVAEDLRSNRALARAYPVEIAAQRIDLAVVANVAKRVGQVPSRKRVGGKSLVHHRQRRHHRRVMQVGVVLAHLFRKEHALVGDRARRERRHVELAAMAKVERLDRMAGALADDVELALEGVLVHVAGSPGDKDLPDDRLDLLGTQREAAVVGGHVAPPQQQLSFGVDRALDFLFARHPRRGLPRQEYHRHTVLPDGRQCNAEFSTRSPKKQVRELDQDAGAVALKRVCARRAAVGQVFEDAQSVLDDRMVLAALDMGNEAQSACVVFARRVIHSLNPGRPGRQCSRCVFHDALTRSELCLPNARGNSNAAFWHLLRRNRLMVPAMLQCGNRPPRRVPAQHRPPGGGYFQRERLAPV